MWEKALKIHDKPYYMRLPLRLPVAGGIWLLAVAFPYYNVRSPLFLIACCVTLAAVVFHSIVGGSATASSSGAVALWHMSKRKANQANTVLTLIV